MRHRKAFFSFAIAAALLLAGTVVMADGGRGGHSATNVPTPAPGPAPLSCSTGTFEVSVSSGPTFVPCDAPGGQCTEIEYEVQGHKRKPTRVFMLQGVGVWDVSPGGQWYAPCEGIPGDGEPGFGEDACHEQAIAIYAKRGVSWFKITLAGLRRTGPTSVAAQNGQGEKRGDEHGHDRLAACTILGLGLEGSPDPHQLVQTSETVDFKGCLVEFTRDPKTGEVKKAKLLTTTSESGAPCQSPTIQEDMTIDPWPVDEIKVKVGGEELGNGKFGDGYFSTGTESCTTRVIGGRVYTWGSPCP